MKSLKYLPLIILLLLSVLALLPASPVIQHTPPRDSGFFFYVGSRLLKGDLLYKNIWDDKPPVIFLLNALGLWISAGSRWGVWIIEVAGILAAVCLAFSILKKPFGNIAAALGIVSGLTILFITLHGGNYTEEYAIPFQFACLFFLLLSEQKQSFWPAFTCGVALGILFFLQQTFISIGIAITLYLVLRSILGHSWKPFIQVVYIGLGAMGVSIVFLAYLAIQGIIPGFWDGAFVYGMIYSNLGLVEHLKALGNTLQFFRTIPLLLISLPMWLLALFLLLWHGAKIIIKILNNRVTGWVLLVSGILLFTAGVGSNLIPGSQQGMGLLQQSSLALGVILIILATLQFFNLLRRLALPLLEKTTYHLSPASTTIIAVAVFWYPLEVLMVNLSGRSYLHYYMALCAICTVLYTFLADQINKILVIWRGTGVNLLVVLGWSIGIVFTLLYNPINTLRVMYTPGGDDQIQQTVRYVVANTRLEDKVLIWGAEPVVNFLSNRSSPLRYAYINTFYTKGYGGKARSAELLADLRINKPQLIIYTGDTPFVNITSDHKCELPAGSLLAGMGEVMKAICTNYYFVGNVGENNWKVYRIEQ